MQRNTGAAHTLCRCLPGKAQSFLLGGAFSAFLFGPGGGGAARIPWPGGSGHAAGGEQIEQDVVAPLIHGPIRRRQAKRIAAIEISAAIDRVARRREITARNSIKQRRRWGKIGVFIRRNRFRRAARRQTR